MTSDAAALKVITALRAVPTAPVALDTETTGLKVAAIGEDFCIGISIAFIDATDTPRSHYFAISHPAGGNLRTPTVVKLWKTLENHRGLFIFANRQFDILSLETTEIRLDNKPFIDICTMAHQVNENTPISKSLNSLSAYYLGDQKVDHPFVEYEKKTGNQTITPAEEYEYAVKDAELTYRVWLELSEHPVWLALQQTDVPAEKEKTIRVLTEMRRRGVMLDMDVVREQTAIAESEKQRILDELGYEKLGPIAMKDLFLDRLKLPVLKRSKVTGAPSFDKLVLEEYDIILERRNDPTAQLVRAYRGWTTALGLLLRPYAELVSSDGRLRCSYNTHRVSTGRLSCSEPNLQQISKDGGDPWNEHIKDCFRAKDGYELVSFDYSQLELRLATAYSGEVLLKEVFNEGRDIFDEMATQLGMKRKQAKTLTYSIQYGAGVNRIKNVFGVSQTEAQRIRSNFWATYPMFANLNERCSAVVKATMQLKLWSGRYRHFQYKSESYKAMNSLIQGGAADIVERVMVRVFEEIDDEDCQLLLQVHDALVFEIRRDKVPEYRKRIKEMMEDIDGALPEDMKGAFSDVVFNVEASGWGE